MLMCYLMDPNTDVYQTEQPQISYSFDFTAEQSRAIQSPNLLGWEGSLHRGIDIHVNDSAPKHAKTQSLHYSNTRA